jgi:hypothetical protein
MLFSSLRLSNIYELFSNQQTIHKDKNDQACQAFARYINQIAQTNSLESAGDNDLKKMLKYIKRYAKCTKGEVGLNTLCCWTMDKKYKRSIPNKF